MRRILAVLAVLALVSCGGGSVTGPDTSSQPSPTPAAVAPTPSPAPAVPAPEATPVPTPTPDPIPTPNPCSSLKLRVKESGAAAAGAVPVTWFFQWSTADLGPAGVIDDGGVCGSWMNQFTLGPAIGVHPDTGDIATTAYLISCSGQTISASLTVGGCSKGASFKVP